LSIFTSKQSRKSGGDAGISNLNLFNKDSLIESIKEDIKM
jgi:hypothetical protein